MTQHHNNLATGRRHFSDRSARAQSLAHKLNGKQPFQADKKHS
jgi:hypothetical protein